MTKISPIAIKDARFAAIMRNVAVRLEAKKRLEAERHIVR